jgi:hypothetical protein
MKPTVAILLSDKRSGSTMLQKELCKHPDISHVSYSPHTYFETHHWLKAACILDVSNQEFYGHTRHKGYGSKMAAKQYMVDCIRGNVPEFNPPLNNRDLVFQGWEALCDRFAKPVFFEKTPHHIMHWTCLDLILGWMGNTNFQVKIIGLVRNPMSVLYSAYGLFHTDPGERQFAWANACRNLIAFKDLLKAEQFHLVLYEDIITQPKEKFQAICKFLNLDYDKEVGAEVHRNSTHKWRDDPAFGFQLHESVARLARHFGYTSEELSNPDKAQASQNESVSRGIRKFYRLKRAMVVDRIIKPFLLRTVQRK